MSVQEYLREERVLILLSITNRWNKYHFKCTASRRSDPTVMYLVFRTTDKGFDKSLKPCTGFCS
jgi:hypothetical protein